MRYSSISSWFSFTLPTVASVPIAPDPKRTLSASARSTGSSKPSVNAPTATGSRSVIQSSSAAEWVSWVWPWPPPDEDGSE